MMVSASLPGFPVGFGVDQYRTPVGTSYLDYSLLNLSYLLPVPLVNITLGAGTGTATPSTTVGWDKGNITQYYLQLGWSFGIFDVHASQRMVTGELPMVPGGGDATPWDVSSSLTTVGVQVGF